MNLADWKSAIGPAELRRRAAEHGIRLATFYEVAGGRVPSVDLARRLSAATDGAVSVAEILGLAADELPADNAAPPESATSQRRSA